MERVGSYLTRAIEDVASLLVFAVDFDLLHPRKDAFSTVPGDA
jgi:hypothetical protein